MNWLKKYYRVLIVVFFFLALIGLTISNHKKSEQLKKSKINNRIYSERYKCV